MFFLGRHVLFLFFEVRNGQQSIPSAVACLTGKSRRRPSQSSEGLLYDVSEFLAVQEYKNVQRWTDAGAKRPAVQRGRMGQP
jgi:hypothetical protein